ncbi:FAD-dependent oxidoreductase [Candidatus Uhrbacteria bacterium]|nr:FAD-dependent oxidoreductase [Candidatus Uhrbacteria bacterium]
MIADYLIIGAGIAGTTAAETIRGRDAGGTIVLVGDEPHPLYSRVLMPHVVRGRVGEANMFLKKPTWYGEKGIEYLSGVAVARVDAARKVCGLSDGREISYGKLLIATGGRPRRLDCPGADDAGLLQLQTVEDARELAAINGGSALVIGGGFIAMEFALSFAHKKIPVTVAPRGDGFWGRVLGERARAMIAAKLGSNGVMLRSNSSLSGFSGRRGDIRATFRDGGAHDCTVVGSGIGIEPNVGFLKGSGVPVNLGVVTDEFLASSAPGVYAAGDVAEFFDLISADRHILGNWTNALLHGKTAGANMAGERTAYKALTSYSINCFDLPIAFLGAVESGFERLERRYDDAVLHCYLREGRVVGAAAVGKFHEREAAVGLITPRTLLDAARRAAFADARLPLARIIT